MNREVQLILQLGTFDKPTVKRSILLHEMNKAIALLGTTNFATRAQIITDQNGPWGLLVTLTELN